MDANLLQDNESLLQIKIFLLLKSIKLKGRNCKNENIKIIIMKKLIYNLKKIPFRIEINLRKMKRNLE